MAVARSTASAARGDAELSIDRGDFRAHGVAGDEQPFADLADREMGLQVREKSKLGRSEGRSAGGSRLGARGDDLAKLRDLVDERPQLRAVEQDVVDLTQQVPGGGTARPWPGTPWRAGAATRTAMYGSAIVHDGRTRIARVSCRSASFRIAAVQLELRCAGEGEHA